MAKGIRVNLLAKELGVESKAILQKLKEEGLSDVAPNHMSTLSIGLAESVREWFSQGNMGGGTAVETAPHVEVATKSKATRTKKKKETTEDEAPGAEVTTTVVEAPPPPPPVIEVPVAPPPPAPVIVAPPVAPAPPPAPVVAPAPVVIPVAKAPQAPASGAQAAARPRRRSDQTTFGRRARRLRLPAAAWRRRPRNENPSRRLRSSRRCNRRKFRGRASCALKRKKWFRLAVRVRGRGPRDPRTRRYRLRRDRAGRGVKTTEEDDEETKKKTAGNKKSLSTPPPRGGRAARGGDGEDQGVYGRRPDRPARRFECRRAVPEMYLIAIFDRWRSVARTLRPNPSRSEASRSKSRNPSRCAACRRRWA